jgi:succinate dehydrogenase / fumarate reductase iron-sulfur subunit
MTIRNVIFKIQRYKPEHIDPPQFQEFTLDVDPNTSILAGLEKIRLEQDKTLMYRRSCHHSSCGTCACKINGVERLTCITKVQEIECDTITLTSLEGFKPVGDLVVDMDCLYDDISEGWSYLKKAEKVKSEELPADIDQFTRFENCIECGACVSSCPVSHKNTTFIGPAALAALNCELKKSPQKAEDLMALAGSKRGEHLCERALNCSRVCPTGVYPARHIADLRRMTEKRNFDTVANPK